MTANQFYVPFIAPDAAQIVLQGEEHRHLARTARVRTGEEVWLFDAAGRRCRARVERVGRDRTDLAILKMEEPAAGSRLFLSEHGGRPLRDIVALAGASTIVHFWNE